MLKKKSSLKKTLKPIAVTPVMPQELHIRNPGVGKHRSYTIYGRSGTGKTTLAASFPKRMLLLDIKDKGDDSVSDVQGLDVCDIKEWQDFELTYWYLHRNPKKYQTLVIDTVTQLQQLAVIKVLNDHEKTTDEPGGWGTMSQRMWGEVASLMKVWIINLRDLPMEVVFLAQDRVFNSDEESGSMLDPEVGPALSPSISKHLNAAVHFIGYTFIRQVTDKKKFKQGSKIVIKEIERNEFCLRVGPNPVYITKVRKPQSIAVPDVITNPSFAAIQLLLKGTP